MDCKRIRLGIHAWLLGILVPAAHHALLHWPVAANTDWDVHRVSSEVFDRLPWIDFVYLGVMALTGSYLILAGLCAKAKDEAEE